jgi:hypothetical protein
VGQPSGFFLFLRKPCNKAMTEDSRIPALDPNGKERGTIIVVTGIG